MGNDRDFLLEAALFRVSFQTDFDPRWWRWKYERMGGISHSLKSKDGSMIAHYAGFPRKMLGKLSHLGDSVSHQSVTTVKPNNDSEGLCEFEALQIGDVMVHPSGRASLKRGGAFVRAARDFIDQWVGVELPKAGRKYSWIYGFPNDRHFRLGEKLLLYADVDPMYELRWDLIDKGRVLNVRRLNGDDLQIHSQFVNEWSKRAVEAIVQRTGACIGRKDANWWSGRFLAWPAYELWASFNDSDFNLRAGLKGIFALRRHVDGSIELLDLIADETYWTEVLLDIHELCTLKGANTLKCWASEKARGFLTRYSMQADIEPNVERLPFSLASGTWAMSFLSGSLWVLSGDTDFR